MENIELSPIQKVLLDTYKAFAAFCKEHNIKYYAAFGTLIGAIRHHGFVPWDDDIDVYMLRPDYQKLVSLKDKLAETTKYALADYHDEGCPSVYIKFYDTTKTFWEFSHFTKILGPFIDVFPIDEWDDSTDECVKIFKDQQRLFWKYRKAISHHPLKEILNDLSHLNLPDVAFKLGKKMIYGPQKKKLLSEIEKVKDRLLAIKGNCYNEYNGPMERRYQKSWFQNSIDMPFEDTTIPVPGGYDDCLTMIFGDYMTPPDVHERTGHHNAFYINLGERLSAKEILKSKSKELAKKESVVSMLIREWKYRYNRK